MGGFLGHQQEQLLWSPPSFAVPRGGTQNWVQDAMSNIYSPSLVQGCCFKDTQPCAAFSAL